MSHFDYKPFYKQLVKVFVPQTVMERIDEPVTTNPSIKQHRKSLLYRKLLVCKG